MRSGVGGGYLSWERGTGVGGGYLSEVGTCLGREYLSGEVGTCLGRWILVWGGGYLSGKRYWCGRFLSWEGLLVWGEAVAWHSYGEEGLLLCSLHLLDWGVGRGGTYLCVCTVCITGNCLGRGYIFTIGIIHVHRFILHSLCK